jgi:exonuclease VII small subunit
MTEPQVSLSEEIRRLEEIVRKLEREDADLDQSLALSRRAWSGCAPPGNGWAPPNRG